MAGPYTDSTQLIDGAGEIFELDNTVQGVASSVTDAGATIVFAGTITDADFRPGDVIKIDPDGAGVEYHRIETVDYVGMEIGLETALANVTVTSDDVTRVWRLMGATQGGIAIDAQTTVQERNVDQVLDAVSVKGDKRTASVKVGLVEMVGDNLKVGLALAAGDISRSGDATTVNVGNSSTNLNTNSFLIIGQREDGAKVTAKIQKAVNTGNFSLKFDKAGNSILQLDLRLINDGSRTAGQELFRLKTDTDYDWTL